MRFQKKKSQSWCNWFTKTWSYHFCCTCAYKWWKQKPGRTLQVLWSDTSSTRRRYIRKYYSPESTVHPLHFVHVLAHNGRRRKPSKTRAKVLHSPYSCLRRPLSASRSRKQRHETESKNKTIVSPLFLKKQCTRHTSFQQHTTRALEEQKWPHFKAIIVKFIVHA